MKKLNLVNGRKEFFNVILEEIKKVVQENHDKTVDFINLSEAKQFRESVMMRKKMNENRDDGNSYETLVANAK